MHTVLILRWVFEGFERVLSWSLDYMKFFSDIATQLYSEQCELQCFVRFQISICPTTMRRNLSFNFPYTLFFEIL